MIRTARIGDDAAIAATRVPPLQLDISSISGIASISYMIIKSTFTVILKCIREHVEGLITGRVGEGGIDWLVKQPDN